MFLGVLSGYQVGVAAMGLKYDYSPWWIVDLVIWMIVMVMCFYGERVK